MRKDGKITLILGVTGSGKTSIAKALMKSQKRILAYDPKLEFCQLSGFVKTESQRQLLEKLKATKASGRIAHCVAQSSKEFDFFTRCFSNWARQKECTAVVEELSAVTSVGKAKDGWNIAVNQSRALGANVLVLAQKPEEIDKSTLDQAKEIYCCQVSTKTASYMGDRFGLDAKALKSFPSEPLKFIRIIAGKGLDLSNGKIQFKDKAPMLYSGNKLLKT